MFNQACNQARSAIERHTSRLPPRALKVCVLLGPFLAHQGHALRLLNWLRKLMGICEGFRLLLADIIMKVHNSAIRSLALIVNVVQILYNSAHLTGL